MQQQIIEALRRGAVDDAVIQARAWVEHEPAQAQAARWLAAALQQQGEHAAALRAIDAAIALAPEQAELHLLRAGLLLAQRELSAADAALARSSALDPNQFTAYVMQAHLAIARQDLDEAERLIRTATRLAADDPQLTALEGTLALHRGEADRALALLSRAVGQLPDDPRVLYALAFAYLRKGHLAFAERALQRVATLTAPSARLHALIAQLAQRQGRVEEALETLRQALTLSDGDTPALRRLAGDYALQAGQPAESVTLLTPVLAAHGGDEGVLQLLLAAWQRLGAREQARATLEAALATNAEQPALWRARLAIESDDGDVARQLVERWLRAMPAHPPALEARMRLHDLVGEHDAAEALARQIIAVEPGRPAAEQRVVEALLQRQPDAAVAHVQALIGRLAEDRRTLLRPWLGQVQDRAGQTTAALATWMQFQREQAGHRLPLPPQSEAAAQWPALAAIPADERARPLLLWGAPGAQVERLAMVIAAASPCLRRDRFGPQPPQDPLQSYRTLARLASGELTPAALVSDWKAGLSARGCGDGNIIDWLLWWDNALLRALRPHLPEGRLAIALRDPRDMLLDWLAFGAPAPLAIQAPEQAAVWLAAMLTQIAELHEQDLYPHRLLRLDRIEADPEAVAQLLGEAFGQRFPVLPTLGGERLPSGRWRAYAEPLATAFATLAPVAERLGYAVS